MEINARAFCRRVFVCSSVGGGLDGSWFGGWGDERCEVIRDFRTWARRASGKDPVVSIIWATGVDFLVVEMWEMRMEARRLRDSWAIVRS